MDHPLELATLARGIKKTVATSLAKRIEEAVATILARHLEEDEARRIQEGVTATSAALSRYLWSLVRAKLITGGRQQVESILDACAPDVIDIILRYVLCKIMSAVSNP